MEKIINYDNLRNFCYSNDKLLSNQVKGILLDFKGLGFSNMFNSDSADAINYANNGIIYVIPYYNPWAWMNIQTVNFVDEIIAVLIKRYSLNETDVKIVSSGESMGGLSALVYCAYAKITPSLCVTSCPVCDLPYHFTERPDLPRTLYSAFGNYNGTITDALKSCSPIHLVDKMPNIPYIIFHCLEDKAVNIDTHSRAFVNKMKNLNSVELKTIPNRDHCDLPLEIIEEYKNAILNIF